MKKEIIEELVFLKKMFITSQKEHLSDYMKDCIDDLNCNYEQALGKIFSASAKFQDAASLNTEETIQWIKISDMIEQELEKKGAFDESKKVSSFKILPSTFVLALGFTLLKHYKMIPHSIRNPVYYGYESLAEFTISLVVAWVLFSIVLFGMLKRSVGKA